MNKETYSNQKESITNNTKVIIVSIIIGILISSTIFLTGTTIYFANKEPQEKIVEVEKTIETPPTEASGLLRAVSADATLIDSNAYIKINNDSYEFDIPVGNHELICNRILVGGETVKIHTSIICSISIQEYAEKRSEATTIYNNNSQDYSFTTKPGMNYYINFYFPAV